METVLSFSAIAVAIIVGLCAVGTAIGFAVLGGKFWKALRVNLKWLLCCKLRCSSSQVCWTRFQ